MGLSPMMVQYKQIKEKYPDTILMFRLGDFYEMFFEDAVTASRELDLTLTGRNCGLSERAPMCGVPYHSVQTYIGQLVKKGYKVAICDQLQDPSEAKGIVERDVTRIISEGTVTDPDMLPGDKNNYLMSLCLDDSGVGAVWTDITTSETYNYYIPYPVKVKLNDLLMRIRPVEIICNSRMLAESVELSAVKFGAVCGMSQYDDEKYDFETAKRSVAQLVNERELKNLCKTPACVCAEGALIAYVQSMQFRSDVNIGAAESFESEIYMDVDANTARTLELTESFSRKRGTTLRDVINKTCTPMGDRQLQHWIMRPLCVKSKIDERLSAVDVLYRNTIVREGLRSALSRIKDVTRISGNLALGEIKPKDVLALGASLRALPDLKAALDKAESAAALDTIRESIDTLPEMADLIERAIVSVVSNDDDKAKEKDASIIKSGFDCELD